MFYVPGALKGLDGFWLEKCLRAELGRLGTSRIDLIDAQFEYPEGVGAVRAARALGLPVFVTLRGLLTKYLKSPSRRAQCLDALRAATGVISVSHSLKRTAEEHGIDGSKIRVIPNAVDPGAFGPGSRAEARRALGVGPEEPLVVTVAHVQPVKGQHDLVEALAQVKVKRGAVRAALIGNHEYDTRYTRAVKRGIALGGLQADITFLGQQPPHMIAHWLRAADVFALPSYHEGCCNAVLEALACGTPVVTTPVGDNANYVDASHGLLVPPGNAAALAGAIDAALDRKWDRRAIAAQMAARTWDHVAGEVLDYYLERLADRTGAPLARGY
jgi:glycosyltransferase involved in cell wall biosynthesis